MTIPLAQVPVSHEWDARRVHTAGSAPGGPADDPGGCTQP